MAEEVSGRQPLTRMRTEPDMIMMCAVVEQSRAAHARSGRGTDHCACHVLMYCRCSVIQHRRRRSRHNERGRHDTALKLNEHVTLEIKHNIQGALKYTPPPIKSL